MKRLSFGHLTGFLTLFLTLTLMPATVWANSYGLPEELTIEVDGTEVKGFFGNEAGVREVAEDSQSELPPEGFVYQVERGPDPQITIAVWSTSKKEALIMKVAEKTLSDLVNENQIAAGVSPGGFLFTAGEHSKFGNDRAAAGPAKRKAPRKLPETADLKPVLATISQEASRIETGSERIVTWRVSPGAYWLLIALLVLVGIAWGQKRRA